MKRDVPVDLVQKELVPGAKRVNPFPPSGNTVGIPDGAPGHDLRRVSVFQQGLAMLGGVMADCFDVRFLICFGVLIRSFSFLLLAFSETTTALLVAMIFTGLGGILFEYCSVHFLEQL